MKINQKNDKNQPHGYWELNWFNGNPWFKCVYKDNKKIGYAETHRYDRFHKKKEGVDAYKTYHII